MSDGHGHVLTNTVDLLPELNISRNGVKPLVGKLARFDVSQCQCGYLQVTTAPKPHQRLSAAEDRQAMQIAADVVGDGGVLLP